MDCFFARTLYTGRRVRDNAYLQFADNTISGVSAARKGERVGEYGTVTPAFIDPHSQIGMHRAGDPGSEAESNEQLDAILDLADALDSVQQ